MSTNDRTAVGASLLEPLGFVMIRVPLLPFDTVQQGLDTPLHSPSVAMRSDHDAAQLTTALAHDAVATRSWLREKIAEPVTREAIFVGSPDLYRAISYWEQNPDSRKGRQAQINLLRYLTRMSTRPTPFGLFAGVALGSLGPAMDIHIGSLYHHRKRTRADMQWLLYLVRTLEQRPEVVSQIRYVTNSMTFMSGERLYLPHVATYGQDETEKTASLRATPIVLRALTLARDGATLDALQQRLLTERPNATAQQVNGLLDSLRQQGALVSSLRPPLTGTNAIHHVLETIGDIPGCDDVCQQLRTVAALAEAYDCHEIGCGLATFQALYDATSIPDAALHSPVEVDMVTGMEAAAFAVPVADEVARAAEMLFRVGTAPSYIQHLAIYRREFVERYGEDREVPLLEMLDEDIGLGPPPTYQHPPRIREAPPVLPPRYPLRERALTELAATALWNRQYEVEIDEDVLRQLQVHDAWQDIVPDSVELYVAIAAASQTAINEGAYRVVVGPRIGAAPVGRSFGRFCDVLGPDAYSAVAAVVRDEETRAPDRIIAELVYMPTRGHAANVAAYPAIRRYEVVVATTPGVAHAQVIALDDLMVGVRGDRFYLRSRSRNTEVVVNSMHLLNYQLAPNACRFLLEAGTEGNLPIHAFDWGSLTQAPFLPRIRSGRIVLCPAAWHLPTDMIEPNDTSPLSSQWYTQIQKWRQRWNVPRYVYLTDNDNRLFLDLENPLCVDDLGGECRTRHGVHGVVTLQEVLPTPEEIWTSGSNGKYLLEFVIPLQRRERRMTPSLDPMERAPVTVHERLRPPGSDWLYAKVYSGRMRHDDLIAGPVREFASKMLAESAVEQWFFIRYADPDPHIRLRFHGDPARLLSQLMPSLAAWGQALMESGVVQKLAFDSYDREIERYGGPEGIRVAERIFATDSAAVADILALRMRQILTLSPLDVALCSVDDLLARMGVAASERLALYRAIRREQERLLAPSLDHLHRTFHSYRKMAQRLVGSRMWLNEQPGGTELDWCLQSRTAALTALGDEFRELVQREQLWTTPSHFLASCVHMHCNRLLGLDRSLEFEVMYYLERTLESLQRYIPTGIRLD